MPDIWRIYHIKDCSYTKPIKNKFTLIACVDRYSMGFFINSGINRFIANRPELAQCQVLIKAQDYWFLDHDSYIDCTKLFSFTDDELVDGREIIRVDLIDNIKQVVSKTTTLENVHRTQILRN